MMLSLRRGLSSSSAPTSSPAVVNFATTVINSSGTSNVITMPSSMTAGNLLICLASPSGNSDSTHTVTSGWSPVISTYYSDNNFGYYVYSKIATGSDTLTFTWNSVHKMAAVVVQVNNSNVVDGTVGSYYYRSSDTTVDPPEHTAGESGKKYLALATAAISRNAGSFVSPSGYTTVANPYCDGSSIAVAVKDIGTATTENPGVFSNVATAWTIASTLTAYYA